jgi:glycosyltransferase involved in cell wall biosynthesis
MPNILIGEIQGSGNVTNMPKVSVIIPTYNRKAMLRGAVESILAQDYPHIEVIVSDNASNDGTDELMKGYTNDNRVSYIRHDQNMGFGYNFKNAFLNVATGQYTMILCDDDCLIDSKYISHAINLFLANPNVVLVHANCKIVNVITNEFQITAHKAGRITKGIDYFINYAQPGYDHIVGVVTAVFNRQKAIDTGAMDIQESYGCDLVLYLRLMLTGDVGVIKDCAGLYRYHQGNISNRLDTLKCDATINELEKTKEMAKEKGIDQAILDKWMNFRVWKYIYWEVVVYLQNGNRDAVINLLASISEKYPEAYHALRYSLNI